MLWHYEMLRCGSFLVLLKATILALLTLYCSSETGILQAPIQIDNLLKHGVNNLVLLLEIFLCRTPFVSYHYQVGLRS